MWPGASLRSFWGRLSLGLCGSALGVGSGLQTTACGDGRVAAPFERSGFDAGALASSDAGPTPEGLIQDEDLGTAAAARDLTIGGPCLDDEQCDDGLDCTSDFCDEERERCRFMPDDAPCQDADFCNGSEVCQPGVGCRQGAPVSCDDETPCTIDRCIEKTDECEHVLRDADGDGDPDEHCVREGGDCNDDDPTVSSESPEICGNAVDDDCDGLVDELRCEQPQFDLCNDALRLDAAGTFAVSTEAAMADYASSCSEDGARDVALLVRVEDGPADVVLTLIGRGEVALARFDECGRVDTELSCEDSHVTADNDDVARLRLRGLPPGEYSVLAFSARPQQLELRVEFEQATRTPDNETCGTAAPLAAGQNVTVDLVGAERDLASACQPRAGDLVYSFELDQPRDVRVFAASLDGLGEPVLSLRDASCDKLQNEIRCVSGAQAQLFARNLAPGRYMLSVSASVAIQLDLLMVTEPPSDPAAGEDCSDPPLLEPDQTIDVDLNVFTDDLLVCQPGARDVVFTLDLPQSSDLLLVERISAGDTGAIALLDSSCSEVLTCNSGNDSPIRSARHGLASGQYRVVAESELGSPVQLTAFVRPARPPTVVALADTCEDALTIPPAGGFFQGNTTNAFADFSAGCDLGGQSAHGAADQLLRLELDQERRVIFDMFGSSYDTLLNLRRGDECPGQQLPFACVIGRGLGRSYLDVVLEAGTYFVQIDGFAGAEGQWFLDVFSAEP